MPSHASPNDSPSPSILLRPQQIAEHPTVSHWPPAVTWTDQCCGSRHLSQGHWYPKTVQCLCENDKHKSKSRWCLRISPTIKTPTIWLYYTSITYYVYNIYIYTWKNSQNRGVFNVDEPRFTHNNWSTPAFSRPFSGHLLRTWTGFRSASVAWFAKVWGFFLGGSINFCWFCWFCCFFGDFGGEHHSVFFCLLILLLGFFANHPGKMCLNSMRFFEIKYLLNFLWFLKAIGFWGPHLLHDFRVVQHQIQLRAVLEELAHHWHWDSVKAERDFHVSKKWPGPRNQHIPPNRKRKKHDLPLSFQTEKGIYVCFFQEGIC